MLLNNGLILLGTGAAQGFPYHQFRVHLSLQSDLQRDHRDGQWFARRASRLVPIRTRYVQASKSVSNSEEGWVKLPNGNVLSYDFF